MRDAIASHRQPCKSDELDLDVSDTVKYYNQQKIKNYITMACK